MDFIVKYKKSIIIGVAALLALILVVSVAGSVNSTRNDLIKKEAALVAQYQDNQNELTTYILKFKESLGIADKGSERIEQILTEAVKGRYDGAMEPGDSGAMFSAITEAYPDLTATSESYAKVQVLVEGGRDAYKNKQTKLLDMVRDYEVWKESDFVRSFIVTNFLGAPTDRLEVTVGDKTYTGAEALKQIKQIVLTREAVQSYETGEMGPLIE